MEEYKYLFTTRNPLKVMPIRTFNILNTTYLSVLVIEVNTDSICHRDQWSSFTTRLLRLFYGQPVAGFIVEV